MSTESFIYLGASPGTSKSDYAIAVPYPTEAPFETSRLVDSGRNASGAMVGRQIGRSLDKQSMVWATVSCEKWWEMNRWIDSGHFTFYCHFFNHNMGRWMTRQYYVSNVKVEPALVQPNGEPAFYRNASFSVIDCGVS